jgi:hypothetical protein
MTTAAAEAAGANPAGNEQQAPVTGFRGSSTGASLARPAEPAATEERPRNPVPAAALGDEGLRSKLRRTEEAARRKLLSDLGVDDPNTFKTRIEQERAELARLKKAEEDAKRSQMTEVERYRADLEAARAETAKRDARIAELEETIYAGQGDAMARAAAAPHVDPEFADYALVLLKRSLHGMSDEQIAEATTEGAMRRFFRRLVAERPKLARAAEPEAPTNPPRSVAAAAPRRPAQQPVPKRQVAPPSALRRAAGAPAQRPAPSPAKQDARGGELNGKTVKPGQPNSMTKAELGHYLAQTGRKMY